ncbi:hypothetical protein [Denitromonas ohlonensis]|uniref:Uncharacterized protein n=2 Tax=Denitromonas TaxID=139331 RepID=A0A557RL92_9RHOO|nr:hypothetical protein [Denitromonas ohlonensis]TVO65939.1 hypothetical protein FHP90_10735 [Denitromonas ohlonensis]TVO79532.1 hypothetical protein FHP89_01920 [Denitromonas ohlonensis]
MTDNEIAKLKEYRRHAQARVAAGKASQRLWEVAVRSCDAALNPEKFTPEEHREINARAAQTLASVEKTLAVRKARAKAKDGA